MVKSGRRAESQSRSSLESRLRPDQEQPQGAKGFEAADLEAVGASVEAAFESGEKVKNDMRKTPKRNLVSLVTIGGYVQ